MIRSIGKQSRESVESVLEKKREATVGRVCSKGKVLTSSGLMPIEARGNYLPEAPYLRDTKNYLNCNCKPPFSNRQIAISLQHFDRFS